LDAGRFTNGFLKKSFLKNIAAASAPLLPFNGLLSHCECLLHDKPEATLLLNPPSHQRRLHSDRSSSAPCAGGGTLCTENRSASSNRVSRKRTNHD
jgi:hypothetical protein